MPQPPRLHWGWLLLLTAVTRGLFTPIWLLVQANWVRKVNGKSRAFVWAIVYLVFFPLLFMSGIVGGLLIALLHISPNGLLAGLGLFAFVGALGLYLVTVFTLRSELEAEPISIPLGGGMTFFFGSLYFQYHLRDFGIPYSGVSGSLGLTSPAPQSPYSAGLPLQGQYLPEASAVSQANEKL